MYSFSWAKGRIIKNWEKQNDVESLRFLRKWTDRFATPGGLVS